MQFMSVFCLINILHVNKSQSYTVLYHCIRSSYNRNSFMRRFWLFWDSVCTVYSESYVNNRKIGKVNRLCKRIEPFPALFWALAGRPGIPKPWYWYGTVRQGSLKFNLMEESLPPTLFLSSCTYSMLWMKPWFRGLKIRIDTPPIYHHCCFGGNV